MSEQVMVEEHGGMTFDQLVRRGGPDVWNSLIKRCPSVVKGLVLADYEEAMKLAAERRREFENHWATMIIYALQGRSVPVGDAMRDAFDFHVDLVRNYWPGRRDWDCGVVLEALGWEN